MEAAGQAHDDVADLLGCRFVPHPHQDVIAARDVGHDVEHLAVELAARTDFCQ